MRTIWKYKLKPGETELKVPRRHVFLHAGIDHADGGVAVWVMVDKLDPHSPDRDIYEDETTVRVRVKETGHDCEDVKTWVYLGTVHQDIRHATADGFSSRTDCYVWHIFIEPVASQACHG